MTVTRPPAPAPDAARAARALDRGWVAREGARVFYEVFGEGEETTLLMPPWSIIHSRSWKAQVPYLARHFRVLTFDGLGNGRSDRPPEPGPYAERAVVAHTLALLDATGTERALVVAHCGSAGKGLLLAAGHPGRVAGLLFVAPALLVTPPRPERVVSLTEPLDTDEGWAKQNVHFWRRDFRGYLEFFFGRCFPEPHSTKQIEDCVGWALETTPATLALTLTPPPLDEAAARDLLSRVRCPVLVVQGRDDLLVPAGRGEAVAEATGGTMVALEGAGHGPNAREPVRFNLLARDFAERVFGRPPSGAPWRRPAARPRRALFVSSPIGLGHAWRDIAVARALRARTPGLEIDWLAQDLVTRVLAACGQRIHPASADLASESDHLEAEAGDHELAVSSRPSGGWTRSWWPTSWSSTTWCARSPTTCGSPTRRGSSTTTCTRTRSSRPRHTAG